jgi:hypothetical protein
MSPRSKANSLLAPCFAENKPNHSIGTPEPLTVCLQQTIDLSILSPKQFVRGTRARAHRQSELQFEQNWDRKKEGRKRSFKLHLLLLLIRLLHFLTKIAMENSLFQSMDGGFKLRLTAHSSFHKIKLSKRNCLQRLFFFVFLNFFFPRGYFLGHHQKL